MAYTLSSLPGSFALTPRLLRSSQAFSHSVPTSTITRNHPLIVYPGTTSAMRTLLPSHVLYQRTSSFPTSSNTSSRCLAIPINARLAKPTTVKGTNTVTSKKQQLAKQLAKQEQQHKKTLAVSKTTRGISSSSQSSDQAGTGPASRRGSRFYFNFTGFPFPLGPFLERNTVRTEVRLLCRIVPMGL